MSRTLVRFKTYRGNVELWDQKKKISDQIQNIQGKCQIMGSEEKDL